MNKRFKTIAVIPARSGSKGLPGKNLKLLLGKPLICWTIEAALDSKMIDLVMVSTDSKEIANISKEYGADVPFLRPKHLATDSATSFSVVEHALNFYANDLNMKFDCVALLEPTSPIRKINDIDNMIEKLYSNIKDSDAIVSLGEVSEHPAHFKIIESDGTVVPYNTGDTNNLRRQDQKKVYFPFGVAYISKVEVLLNEKTFYPKRTLGYIISRNQNYEVDDIYDFICIESLLKNNAKVL